MNLRQEYAIKRIIRETVINNKEKSLNEIKRLVKAQIRVQVNEEVASTIGADEIVEVINSEGILSQNEPLTIKRVNVRRNDGGKGR